MEEGGVRLDQVIFRRTGTTPPLMLGGVLSLARFVVINKIRMKGGGTDLVVPYAGLPAPFSD